MNKHNRLLDNAFITPQGIPLLYVEVTVGFVVLTDKLTRNKSERC